MGVVPDSRIGKIQFYENHIADWTANAVAIGLTVPKVTLLSTAIVDARAAFKAHEQAQTAAKLATQNFYEKVAAMHSAPGMGADMIKTIRTFAESTNDPNVYQLAQIPAPLPPVPAAPPGKPTDLGATLNPTTGEITLGWKAVNPASGTSYLVMRKLPGQSEFNFVGVTGTKKFTDSTFIAGPDRVEYAVQGQRAGASGPISNALVINFGRAGGDSVITSVSEAA